MEPDRLIGLRAALMRHGFDIGNYDEAFLLDALGRNVGSGPAGSGWAAVEGLIEGLEGEGADGSTLVQAKSLADSLNIGYSEFFREVLGFACLETLVLPELFARRRQGSARGEIRIWSAACAAGQEAYSLAILCEEQARLEENPSGYRIFATDVDEGRLEEARRGLCSRESLRRLSLGRLEDFFAPAGKAFSVLPRLRERVEFSRFDLVSDPGTCPPASIYGHFDLVLCANMLFYYRPEIRARVLSRVASCLAPGAYLLTGAVEREIAVQYGFVEAFPASAIFRLSA